MKNSEKDTLLNAKEKVRKDCAQICLRGEIDSLYAQAVFVCSYAKQYGYIDIISGLEDIVRVVRELMHSEATGKLPQAGAILGLDFDELRKISNNPQAELGIEPFMPDENTDDMTALINVLRADIRRAERAAVAACADGENMANDGIQLALNRLSSAAYILMLESFAAKDMV